MENKFVTLTQLDRRECQQTIAGIAERIEKEIAIVPAFNEDLNTVTGQPHGHILYSWNSGYSWLRKMFRQRMNRVGDDPVDTAINRKLNIVRDRTMMLRLRGEITK